MVNEWMNIDHGWSGIDGVKQNNSYKNPSQGHLVLYYVNRFSKSTFRSVNVLCVSASAAVLQSRAAHITFSIF